MGSITSREADGKISIAYTVDGTTADGHAITKAITTIWFDGEIDVKFHGVPLTANGTPDKRRKPAWIHIGDTDRDRITAELGIDTTVRPFLDLLEQKAAEYALAAEAEQQAATP